MKKIICIIIILTCLFSLFGCEKNITPISDNKQDMFVNSFLNDDNVSKKLNDEERDFILSLLDSEEWIKDIANCYCDYQFLYDGKTIKYSSTCGTFVDLENRRSLEISDMDTEKVNQIVIIKDMENINQNQSILYAWKGSLTDKKYASAINKYKTDYKAFEYTKKDKYVTLEPEFEVSGYRVVYISYVDEADEDAERTNYIDLSVESNLKDNKIQVRTDWRFYEKSFKKSETWSYLVCVYDQFNAKHFYYFRVNYIFE